MKALSNVLPLINASGATSIVPLSRNLFTLSPPSISNKASYNGLKYGSTLSFKSPGKNPKLSPASTAGLVNTILFTSSFLKALTAIATAR